MLSMGLLESVIQDLRYAIRTTRKNPIFVTTAVLTLALAIGGNTAMFTIIRAVLLNPLQYHDPDRLVRLSGGATPTRFAEMRTGARSFAELGAYTGEESITLSGGSEPEILKGARVSASFLRILGIDPMRGRGFRLEEDSPGGIPVAMISAELWQRRFGGDPQIIGTMATLAATRYMIIGILPPRFQFPFPGVDVWMTAPSELPQIPAKSRALSPFLTVFGRLKPGLNLEQANAEMRVIRRQYAAAHPAMLDAKPKTPVEVTAMKDELVGKVRSMLWMLFGAVGFVLMIACANVANLLLTRATSRTREFAVRSALGAARIRLIGQLLTESILLSAFGGALGVLIAAFSLRAIPSITAFNSASRDRNSYGLGGARICRSALRRNRCPVRIGALAGRLQTRSDARVASQWRRRPKGRLRKDSGRTERPQFTIRRASRAFYRLADRCYAPDRKRRLSARRQSGIQPGELTYREREFAAVAL